MQSTSESAAAVGSDVLSDAKSLGATALDRVHSELDNRKGTAAAQVKSVSTALETAVDQLDPGTPQWLKSALEQGASQIQAFAASLEQKDSRELAAMVSDFARQSPGTFLGSCAAAGFAAARVLKAGGANTGQGHRLKSTDTASDAGASIANVMGTAPSTFQPQSAPATTVTGGQLL